jgi:hypothetical protein
MALLSPYTTNKKRSGDKGQPCFKPLSGWKKQDVDPLIIIAKETIVKKHITQLMNGTSKPK